MPAVPAWFASSRTDLDAWLATTLGRDDWQVRQARPWSVVGRMGDDGPWVKAMPPASRHEVAVLVLLAGLAPDAVPGIRAADADRGWIVLDDGGPVLRTLEGGQDAAPAWRAALRTYARLQRHTEDHVEALRTAGVPDARGHELLARLDDLLADATLVGRGRPWGLTITDERRLAAHRPRLEAAVDELVTSPVADAIQHDDLHGNNVLVGGPRIVDWGDAALGHPFASMTTTLRSIPHHTPSLADDLGPLVAAYLETWTDVAPPGRLRRDLRMARHLGAVMRAMSWARAVQNEPMDHPDRAAVPRWLLALLEPLPADVGPA
ncbi:phosphotransferase family protein [Salsipaludibacter albus]|uniref:phosphotransferase family protein n=1 Tax=Salsipaludibacter albus TaxID=2849650 RepID=UPI001EE3D818|nr:phosphotransferase [Salsipaludibacter albus]MBY5162227.1 aminoglycoside phosphotransferase family protein [Salsipaludibacter albus]